MCTEYVGVGLFSLYNSNFQNIFSSLLFCALIQLIVDFREVRFVYAVRFRWFLVVIFS